jgi:hypothetical protein
MTRMRRRMRRRKEAKALKKSRWMDPALLAVAVDLMLAKMKMWKRMKGMMI